MSLDVAALFVLSDGPYAGLAGVDLWDRKRDARKYPGTLRVVAHPPCERWGRYWGGGPSARVRRVKGDDGGCFESALRSVRTFGGVLEHPADSSAWEAFGLLAPPRSGGLQEENRKPMWVSIDLSGYYEAGPSYLYGWALTKMIRSPWGWNWLDVAYRHPGDALPTTVAPFVSAEDTRP